MLNKVMLIGNLGKDVEVRYTQTGTAVANFSMATSRTYKTADGQKGEHTEWHNIVTFGRLAEICGEYLAKGSKVYIEGRIQTRSWEKDGVKRYTTEVVGLEMKMMSSNRHQDSSAPADERQDTPPYPEPIMGDDVPF